MISSKSSKDCPSSELMAALSVDSLLKVGMPIDTKGTYGSAGVLFDDFTAILPVLNTHPGRR